MATFPLKPAGAKTVGVTYKMARLPVAAESDAPAPASMLWFSDLFGAFGATSEAAYLLPEPDNAAGPVLGVVGFSGDIGGATVVWSTEWTPEIGEGGDPGITIDGGRLIAWPRASTQPGILLVSATVNGRRYGPIAMTVLRYAGSYCYCGDVSAFSLDPLTWSDGSTDITVFANDYYLLVATATGTWPAGTLFEWTIDDNISLALTENDNTLAIGPDGSSDYGYLEATLTATTPTGETITVGPINLTVSNDSY